MLSRFIRRAVRQSSGSSDHALNGVPSILVESGSETDDPAPFMFQREEYTVELQ